MPWWDFYKVFTYVFTDDPISLQRDKDPQSAGVSQVGAIPSTADGNFGGAGGTVRIRQTNHFVDFSSINNRTHRYSEYERLRNMGEIDTVMTVFADETCIAGDTRIATPSGYVTIKRLVQTTRPDEKFLVYCYDFNKQDYVLGWASKPRLTKTAQTVRVVIDDGHSLVCTPDHRVLLRDGTWQQAGKLKEGDELMPFYRIEAKYDLNDQANHVAHNQFPRIWTHRFGWIHERQFVNEWRTGHVTEKQKEVNHICQMVQAGLTYKQMEKITGNYKQCLTSRLKEEGFTISELKTLREKKTYRRVLGVLEHTNIAVYDLTVAGHHNFATDFGILHNCQNDDEGRPLTVNTENKSVREELEYLLFHRKMLNLNQPTLWNICKQLFTYGDYFMEIVIDINNPKAGILGLSPLPPATMFRIETTKGKLIEFQQSKEQPDYKSLEKIDITMATDADLQQSPAIRFAPEEIIHFKIGEDRTTFYPYGVSLMEPARSPAHQLRLMEDAMIVNRLVRAPERKVFYIDHQGMPGNKVEAFMEKLKEQFRTKKVGRSGLPGASSAEDRYHAPAADENIWIPIRPNSNTRVETLPGACLSLDTEIPLLDGRTLTLQQMIEEYDAGKHNWVYSCCPKTGKTAPGIVSWAGVTRKNTQVVRLTFDNGKTIICTPDHKFPVQNEGFVEAKDLLGKSVFPFQKQLNEIGAGWHSLYEQVYDSSERKWVFTHRMVGNSVKGTAYEQSMVFNEEHAGKKQGVLHHVDIDKYNNTPPNLAWMNWDDHKELHKHYSHVTKEHISKALKSYHANLTEEEKAVVYARLRDGSLKEKQLEGIRNNFIKHPELLVALSKKTTERNNEFWSDPENKVKVFAKQTIVYPQEIFDFMSECFECGYKLDLTLDMLNERKDLLAILCDANNHLKREGIDLERGLNEEHANKMAKAYGFKGINEWRKKLGVTAKFKEGLDLGRPAKPMSKVIFDRFLELLKQDLPITQIIKTMNSEPALFVELQKDGRNLSDGFNHAFIRKLLKAFGYTGIKHVREEAANYNHKVIKIEYLEELMDTGTLTIDANHEIHDYHTFAIKDICYTKNSNLGETDDTIYFRNKLFAALNFPKNYFNNEDPQTTRLRLADQNVQFAKLVERLQAYVAEGIWTICDRHLKLLGYAEEDYEDLVIKMTPPSDYREASRAELLNNRITIVSGLKQAQIMSDFDLLTKFMKYSEEDAKEMIARNKLQMIDQIKMQIAASNPEVVGIGLPNPNEPEVGAEPGGPNPMLSPPQAQQQPQQPPMPGAPPDMAQPPGQPKFMDKDEENSGTALPDPSEEDIRKMNLEIQDSEQEIDDEEHDYSED